MRAVELSIVVPMLDEEATLPDLLTDLAAQQTVSFELLLVDGGSTDRTRQVAASGLQQLGLTGAVLDCARGRGRQLNVGAARASGDWLLFLHADSRLPEPDLLSRSLALLRRQAVKTPAAMLAGHLSLEFAGADAAAGRAYTFYQAKARSGRPGTIHGDQGFWVRADDLQRLGGYREDLPVMEDSAFAETLRARGEWLLLPGRIVTSPRRFEAEGLAERQTLNALLMNFLTIDWLDFIHQAPALYRQQSLARRLDLLPFFDLVETLLAQMPAERRRAIWLATGRYVRGQAWQIGFYLDLRNGRQHWTDWFDRRFLPWTDRPWADHFTAWLVKRWFYGKRARMQRAARRTGAVQNAGAKP
ncbi:MAG: TIGR04283 family arsenosugar biosynthesis glycosyltransferase [Desulfuromonadales bacterium]|nr:TIGR04283 family arsenosugar biosynthesis glycosyltransferase [Desulfuromonadales bacterium]